MARGSSTKKDESKGGLNPEAKERIRRKKLAFSNDILSETQAKVSECLTPSGLVIKHHGKDILKKSQRKNRFLFSFPGLIAPIGGGKIGELKDLGTKNPILYLDFPQGRIKLFGTIVYPKNRYLTLQFPRGGKNVTCEDYFDNMIVFSNAWWIGRKDENPAEARLDFPKELDKDKSVENEYDFKGGAGAASRNKHCVQEVVLEHMEKLSPKVKVGVDLSDSEDNLKDLMKATPTRHSERTAGRRFKFIEDSPGEDSVSSDADISEEEEKKVMELDSSASPEHIRVPVFLEHDQIAELSASKSSRPSQSTGAVTLSKENACNNRGSLVQATISNLFKKVEEKASGTLKRVPSSEASGQKVRLTKSKQKISQDKGSQKRRKVIKGKSDGQGSKTYGKVKEHEVEDDIEDFSSTPEDSDDEDWAA